MKMINIKGWQLAWALIIGVCLGFSACNKMDDIDEYGHFKQPARIGLLDTLLELDVQGNASQTIVTLNGGYEDWQATTSADWITLQKGTTDENGKTEQTIVVGARSNTYYSRTATVKVTMWNGADSVSKNLRVVQESALDDPAVSVAETVVNINAESQSKTVEVTTNQSTWTANANADWLTVTQAGSSLLLQVAENTTADAREATVTIVAGTAPYTATTTFKVVQAKPDSKDLITVAGIELVRVEGGSFMMGAQNTDPTAPNYGVAAAGSGYNANQSPVHKVTLSEFYIGKFQVTQDQWVAVMGSNPSKNIGPGRGNYPVEYVDWNMASEFVAKLSQQTGKTFRLPTEAEWEFAARGGNKSRGFLYSGGNVANQVGNMVENTADRNTSRTTAVGSFLPNELGIYDMTGNLYEWCSDYYGPYSADDQVNPTGPATGTNRVMRGGSWWHLMTTVYYRGNNTPNYTGTHANAGLTGFRVVYIP